MGRVEFVYFDAGGGHRAAATALRLTTGQQLQWDVHLMNLQELLDSIDPVLKLSGLRLQDLYNWLLKMGWTWGAGAGLRALQAAIRLYHPQQVRLLQEYWRKSQPALVVSLVPHFNRALFESLRRVSPDTPFVTVQKLESEKPQYAYWTWKLSEDGTLSLRDVNDKIVPDGTKDSATVRKLLKENLRDPALFEDEIQMTKDK